MGPLTPLLIGAGASLLGQGANAFSQGSMNRKTRKWNENMYNLQRQHALADWNMQNEYNSPAQQMARLKAAGLNPNLVYGNGATATGGTVRSVDTPKWNPEAPQFDLGGAAAMGLQAYYDFKVKNAQADLLITQNTVAQQEAALKGIQAAKVATDTAKTKFELDFAKDTRLTSLQTMQENLRKLQVTTDIALQENERRAALSTSSIKEAAERILTMRANRAKTAEEMRQIQQQIKNLQADETLKQLDINLKKSGVQPHDNVLLRMLGQALSDFDPVGALKKGIKSLFGF